MHEGKVIHFEDDGTWRGVIQRQLADSEHELVGNAATLPDALEVLEQMQRGELDANVVVLDGNLSDVSTNHDAKTIRRRIRELGLPVRVIGFSSGDLADSGVEVDATMQKGDYSYGEIIRVIDELEEPEIEVVESEAEVELPVHLDVGFAYPMRKEDLAVATPGLELDKYVGEDGLLGQLAKSVSEYQKGKQSSENQRALREAASALVEAVKQDNKIINQAAGREQDGFG